MNQAKDSDILCVVADSQEPPRLLYAYTTLLIGWILGVSLVYVPSPWALGLFFLLGPIPLVLSLPLISVQVLIARKLQHHLPVKLTIRFVHRLAILYPVLIPYLILIFTLPSIPHGDLLLLALFAFLSILTTTVFIIFGQLKKIRLARLTLASGLLIIIPHIVLRLFVRLSEYNVFYDFFIALVLFYCAMIFGFSLGLILLGIQSEIKGHTLGGPVSRE